MTQKVAWMTIDLKMLANILFSGREDIVVRAAEIGVGENYDQAIKLFVEAPELDEIEVGCLAPQIRPLYRIDDGRITLESLT